VRWRLPKKGLYTTTPNPRVGCVLVRDGVVVGEGWHEKAGAPHAEANALAAAGPAARGATAYVSLEPCKPPRPNSRRARQRSPARASRRVVAAVRDPNPQARDGAGTPRGGSLKVEHGLLEEEARELNIGFFSRMTRAASLGAHEDRGDPRCGVPRLQTGAASGSPARRHAGTGIAGARGLRAPHRDRHCQSRRSRLTVREVDTPRQPLRVVVDSRWRFRGREDPARRGQVLLFSAIEPQRTLKGAEQCRATESGGKVDLPGMLGSFARRGVNELHVEAGFD
jgi:diaminohydroxyphosphoribosylaminopyrimidine deaminase/5-amino-6-(5-phosphoribosylamino)uracil reductase